MVYASDGGGHEPRQAKNWTHDKHDRNNQQIQMIAARFLRKISPVKITLFLLFSRFTLKLLQTFQIIS